MSVEARVEALLEPDEELWVVAHESHVAGSVDSGIKGRTFKSTDSLPVVFTSRRMIRVGVARETGRTDGGHVVDLDPGAIQSIPYDAMSQIAIGRHKASGDLVITATPCLYPSARVRADPLEQPSGGEDKLVAFVEQGRFLADSDRAPVLERLAARYGVARQAELSALERRHKGRKNTALRLGCGCLGAPWLLALVPVGLFLLRPVLRAVGLVSGPASGTVYVGLCQAPIALCVGLLGALALFQLITGHLDAWRADGDLARARAEIEDLRREGAA